MIIWYNLYQMIHFAKDLSMIEKIVLEFSNVNLFKDTEKHVLKKCLEKSFCELIKLTTGEKITLTNKCLLVMHGVLQAEKVDGQKSVYLKKITDGEITGIATLFDRNGQYISTLTAKCDTDVIIVGEDFIASLIETNPVFAKKFAALLCEKIRFLNTRIDSFTQTCTEEKLLEFLRHTTDKNTRCINMSMSSLSSALSMGRASLYRALNSLEAKGIIRKDGKKIYLLSEV